MPGYGEQSCSGTSRILSSISGLGRAWVCSWHRQPPWEINWGEPHNPPGQGTGHPHREQISSRNSPGPQEGGVGYGDTHVSTAANFRHPTSLCCWQRGAEVSRGQFEAN